MQELLEEEEEARRKKDTSSASVGGAAQKAPLPPPCEPAVIVSGKGARRKGGAAKALRVFAVDVTVRWTGGGVGGGWEARRAQAKVDGTERAVQRLERTPDDKSPFAIAFQMELEVA
jgi:hypothetical protein